MIRRLLVSIAAGTLAASIADTALAQQLVQRRDVSYALALAIATGAVDACRALGFTSSAVVVVGRGGDTSSPPATTTLGRTPWRPRAARPTPRAPSRSPRPTSRRK